MELLHPGHELDTAEKCRRYRNLRELVGRLNPIPLTVKTAIKLRLQIKRKPLWLPGNVGAGAVYLMILKSVLVGFPYLQPGRFQENAGITSREARGLQLVDAASGRKIGRVLNAVRRGFISIAA